MTGIVLTMLTMISHCIRFVYGGFRYVFKVKKRMSHRPANDVVVFKSDFHVYIQTRFIIPNILLYLLQPDQRKHMPGPLTLIRPFI